MQKDGTESLAAEVKKENGVVEKDKGADVEKDKGVYVGVEDEDEDDQANRDDGLGDIWQELSMALECSKVGFC